MNKEEINELLNMVKEACHNTLITDEEIMMIINNGNPDISKTEMVEKLIEEKRKFLDQGEAYLDQLDDLLQHEKAKADLSNDQK